jgi:carbonic anhydrase/acetyltransferase-like protein (isoleucine patch superfamily)
MSPTIHRTTLKLPAAVQRGQEKSGQSPAIGLACRLDYALTVVMITRTREGYFRPANCTIVGDVTIGPDSSIWFGAVIRGDVAPVSIGRRVNVQDNAVIHCDTGVANVIENDVTIGHGAIAHGKFVGEGSLIGMSATLLARSSIGKGCLVAAGAVVPPDMAAPDGMLLMGVPAKILRPVKPGELQYMQWLIGHYLDLAEQYAAGKFDTVGL